MIYRAEFTARKIGAIGTWSKFQTTIEGDDEESARINLYEHYEHISDLKLTPAPELENKDQPRT